MSTSHRRLYFTAGLLLFAALMLAAPAGALAQVSVGISVTIGPPPLPVYVQPPCPVVGYVWVPGYWAWDPNYGYYWVPGMWAPVPFYGALWTPGYWGWSNGIYLWHDGYWGTAVGFYGGINYGYGYTGYGYSGGYWRGNVFYYNRTVNNINTRNVTHYYSEQVRVVHPGGASFNGPGGISARPTPAQLDAGRKHRVSMTREQEHQMRAAREDPRQRVRENRGRPAVAATVRPGVFTGRGITGTRRGGTIFPEPGGRRTGTPEGIGTARPHQEMHQPGVTPRMERERRYEQPAPGQHQKNKAQPPREEMGRGGRGRAE
jgi:hypothetical protein